MKYEARKGNRLHRYFIWYEVKDLWYVKNLKRWMTIDEAHQTGLTYSTCCRCRSLRAFQRHLRKHNLKNKRVVLVNKYSGYDIEINPK